MAAILKNGYMTATLYSNYRGDSDAKTALLEVALAIGKSLYAPVDLSFFDGELEYKSATVKMQSSSAGRLLFNLIWLRNRLREIWISWTGEAVEQGI